MRKPLALVIENEGDANCCDWLEREGLDVLKATSQGVALKLALERHPDLIVINVGLPRSGGKELALEMKLLPELARVPVLRIQAGSGEASEKSGKVFDGSLAWPLRRAELRRIVGDVLGRRVTREVKARRDRPLRMKS